MLKLKNRDSGRDSFGELNILTFPCRYMMEVALYCYFETELVQGRAANHYGTRGHNFRTVHHRTVGVDHLPTQVVGVGLLNKPLEDIKSAEEGTFLRIV